MIRVSRCYSAKPNPLTHYVIVRADLPRGIQAAQVVHAAGESPKVPVPEGTFAVCLVCPSERDLVKLADELRKKGVRFSAIFEPDAPYDGALMALGLEPGRKEDLRRHVSALALLR